MLGNVAVRHPHTGMCDVEQNVDRLAGPHEHRVFPHKVWLNHSIARQDQETPCAMNMEWVLHRMVGIHLVDQADLHAVADAESPVDGLAFRAG